MTEDETNRPGGDPYKSNFPAAADLAKAIAGRGSPVLRRPMVTDPQLLRDVLDELASARARAYDAEKRLELVDGLLELFQAKPPGDPRPMRPDPADALRCVLRANAEEGSRHD